MHVTVAGATGFLGGYLLEALLEEGIKPLALVRQESDLSLIDRLGVKRRIVDLRDKSSLERALQGGEVIINAAGKVADWGEWRDFYDLNVRGTTRLLAAAAKNGIKRFIQVSSISAYGMRFFGSGLLTEETPFQSSPVGRDFYCRSKFLAEQEVKASFRSQDLEFVIFRPGIIIGERNSSAAQRICFLIQKGRTIFNLGKMEEKIQINHARDVARAIIRAGIQGPPNEMYNISSPPEISRSEFWARALRGLQVTRKIVEVPYCLGLAAGWATEQSHRISGRKEFPAITLWSTYLMGNRNLIDASKLFDLGWRPEEDAGQTIERSLLQYRRSQDYRMRR